MKTNILERLRQRLFTPRVVDVQVEWLTTDEARKHIGLNPLHMPPVAQTFYTDRTWPPPQFRSFVMYPESNPYMLAMASSYRGIPIVHCPDCDRTTLRDFEDFEICPHCSPDFVEATEHGMPFPYFQRVAATGKTERLKAMCAACGEVLPNDAQHCIYCGAEVPR